MKNNHKNIQGSESRIFFTKYCMGLIFSSFLLQKVLLKTTFAHYPGKIHPFFLQKLFQYTQHFAR